ncbi:hypothetical protein [Pseudonocardia sp. Ae717_Ps2]|uniref:hypothetical protein n=1 Tax=Pseudonocardia sp. Ae717_Ps2 TaxID=1885573 RepID=UPI001E467EDF|nr:hypothetical protein [Pseudonocardia sp. Ae717_Ps2]
MATAAESVDASQAATPGWVERPRSLPGMYQLLGTAARRGSDTGLDVGDVEMIVDLAAAHAARATVTGSPTDAVEIAEQAGAAVTAVADRGRQVWPTHVGAADWSGHGAVIPVLAGSPGAGASTVAAAIADVAHQGKRCCLLVDADAPARSGLAQAAGVEGPWTRPISEQVQVRYSWRGRTGNGVLLARLDTTLPGITPGMVPVPPDWLPDPPPAPLHVTVVDLGHGGWRAAAAPIAGPGGWLRAGAPAPRPVLVVRATRPSLRRAEQLLARHESWVQAGVAAPVAQLVVNAAKRWPGGIDGTAGPHLAGLLDDAVFLPAVGAVELAGVTAAVLPSKMLDALRPLLASWGVIDVLAGSAAARQPPRPNRGPVL